ncbi:MAG TPA: hypothetical protein DD000_08090, partial [Cyanobacteria bacterium UBA11166]|nr:hypothetical protein [Cyanobacteria bacterium UBA11166]
METHFNYYAPLDYIQKISTLGTENPHFRKKVIKPSPLLPAPLLPLSQHRPIIATARAVKAFSIPETIDF